MKNLSTENLKLLKKGQILLFLQEKDYKIKNKIHDLIVSIGIIIKQKIK